MKNLEEENELLKSIIEDLIEILHDVMQPNYKQFYYNFIVLKYDIFPTFKSHIAIACDSKKKKMYNSICDSNIDQVIMEEKDFIKNEILYILKNCNNTNFSDRLNDEVNDLIREFTETCKHYSTIKRKNKNKFFKILKK